MTETKSCLYCGRDLKGRRSNAKFCGDNHRVLYHVEKRRNQYERKIELYRAMLKWCIREQPYLRNHLNAGLRRAGLEELE